MTNAAPDKPSKTQQEKELYEALKESFPASDPPAQTDPDKPAD